MINSSYDTFFERIKRSLEDNTYVKITTSEKKDKKNDLKSISVKKVIIKDGPKLSFTYRHKTKDVVKNFEYMQAVKELQEILSQSFWALELFTTQENIKLSIDNEGKTKLRTSLPEITEAPDSSHDKQKRRYIETRGNTALQELGILNDAFEVIPSMQDKFKQIDKFLEIIDGLIKQVNLPTPFHVSDMGSGKGYLTFALYDYLANTLNLPVEVSGIEFRPALVNFCNEVARKVNFQNLHFHAELIENIEIDTKESLDDRFSQKRSNLNEWRAPKWTVLMYGERGAESWVQRTSFSENPPEILIALHACDTATDDAIYKGIISDSSIIICSPCCHKQVRNQIRVSHDLKSILKNGILEERQAEIATDGIRALLMEAHGYETKVFEYISSEHTGKNLMITGVKTGKKVDSTKILEQVAEIKKLFGIKEHYLEKLLREKRGGN